MMNSKRRRSGEVPAMIAMEPAHQTVHTMAHAETMLAAAAALQVRLEQPSP